MAFAEDFDHLSLQMGNRGETCGRSSPIGQVCYGCATNWFRQDHSLWELCLRVTEIKRHPIVVILPRCSITEDHISMGSCLRGEREFVKGNGFKQILSHYFCRTSSVFWLQTLIDKSTVLNKNLSLIVVDEHHTVETCQNTATCKLTFILQIWQKSVASFFLAFCRSF